MRLVASFNQKKQAARFCDFLMGQGIDAEVRDGLEVWVLDDRDLDQCTQYYEQFQRDPNDPQFQSTYRERLQRERESTRRLKANYRQFFKRPSGNQITIFLIVVCVLIYLLTLTAFRGQLLASLMIGLPGINAVSLWASQPWRLITPMFLHFGILHILFNMFWLYDLGSLIERKERKIFYVLLILIAAIFSNLLQFFVAGPLFGGMSGVVYALFGYIWISSKYNLSSGYYMSNQIVFWMLGWFVLCFTGLLGPVANYGHLGGLLAGCGFAYFKRMRSI